MMKRQIEISLALLLVLLPSSRLSAGTPFMHGAGMGRAVVPLPVKPGDQAVMERQRITADLYPGMAVVRNEALLANRSARPLKLRLGLPRGGSFSHDEITLAGLDTLYGLSVSWKHSPRPVTTAGITAVPAGVMPSLPSSYRDLADSWYLWEIDIPAGDSDTLFVSYAVRTGPAELFRGANVRKSFFFGFLLEQSRAWNGQMQLTELEINLMEGLSVSRIYAVYPRDVLRRDRMGRLFFSVPGRSPAGHDNILIGYDGREQAGRLTDYLNDPGQFLSRMARVTPDSADLRPMTSGRFDVYPYREYLILGVLAASLAIVALVLIYLIKRR